MGIAPRFLEAKSSGLSLHRRLRHVGGGLFLRCFLALPALASAAEPPVDDPFRGGKVEWARLKTDGPYWNRHAEYDVDLLELIRVRTSLNIEKIWYSASARNLEELCTYPFLFTDNVERLRSTAEQHNLAEYLRRGGFLLIDACVNSTINPDPERFLRAQIQILAGQFPDLRVEKIEPRHPVFSIYFKIPEQPQTRPGNSWSDGPTFPLRGVFSGERMIAMVSLSGLQCGWAQFGKGDNAARCMQMVTNIYLYAITH